MVSAHTGSLMASDRESCDKLFWINGSRRDDLDGKRFGGSPVDPLVDALHWLLSIGCSLIAHIAIVMTIGKLVLNLRISNELKKRNSLARQSNHFSFDAARLRMTFDFKSSETK